MSLHRFAAHLGSLRSTLALLALLAAVVLARPAWPALTLAIGALALNLGAALVVHPLLRRQAALLVAHLALLALVAGVGLGRMMALDGRFELTQGVPFDGTLLDASAGPLHRPRLQQLAFAHEGFEIDYAAGRRRGATRNTVSWRDEHGTPQRAVIGDHVPLRLSGHRIYTSPNKGFAPLLQWTPDTGEPVTGSVHLPSYPMHELRQSRAWRLPDGREAWVQLELDAPLIDAQAAARWRMPGPHALVLRVGDERHLLRPGEQVALDGGRLRYVELRSWMGYRVAYDPTLPWLLASALLATLAFAVHYAALWRAAKPAPRLRPGVGAAKAGAGDG